MPTREKERVMLFKNLKATWAAKSERIYGLLNRH